MAITRMRDGASRAMMKAYNESSRGWNKTHTRKEDKRSNIQLATRSYSNNPMTTRSICTGLSHVGSGTHGTKKITNITGIPDTPRSNTIKGELFLIVGSRDRQERCLSGHQSPYFKVDELQEDPPMPKWCGNTRHIEGKTWSSELTTAAEYPAGHKSSVQ